MSSFETALQPTPVRPAEHPGHRYRHRGRWDGTAIAAVALLLVCAVLAIAGPSLSPNDPTAVDFTHRFARPSSRHLLGTDQLGRDELSRLLYAARYSIGLSLVATTGITLLGLLLGLLTGCYGRLVDTLVMRLVDVLLALPTLVLALVVVGVLGQGLRNLVIAVVLVGWPPYARLVRGLTLSLRERAFVEASVALGFPTWRIAVKDITPNLLGQVIVLSTLDLGRILLAVSGLSFLGFGIAPPTPEWGSMLAEARSYLDRAPMLLVYPGLAITAMAMCFNIAGDGLRDVLDPQSQTNLLTAQPRRIRRAARGRRPS